MLFRNKFSSLITFSLLLIPLVLASCGDASAPPKVTLFSSANAMTNTCPGTLSKKLYCYTPHALRTAYGVQSLAQQGQTGKGQTIVMFVGNTSPTLQKDMDTFSKQFDLPTVNVKNVDPFGTPSYDAKNNKMLAWAERTTLDAQIMHSVAPEANITVVSCPQTSGDQGPGLPEFLKLEQYAATNKLGQIFLHSYVIAEAALTADNQQLAQSYSDFYQQITTTQGITILASSGDYGAAGLVNSKLSSDPTVNFPASLASVTAVGGTALTHTKTSYNEVAWHLSGGGVSSFVPSASFQQSLPASAQKQIGSHRGVPDVAANADALTGSAVTFNGKWLMAGGTSASASLWAGLVAVTNQMLGHPIGFLNPLLYKLAASNSYTQDFHNITLGNNSVQTTSTKVTGYSAGKNWSPVVGLGTPDASKLLPDLVAASKSQK